MKGLSHLAVGLAWTSCLPGAVDAAGRGHPGFFALAAVCALLPDTLDFRFARFLHTHHVEIVPDPLNPDPVVVSAALADAADRAAEQGRAVTVRLHPVRVSHDLWRRYDVIFDPAGRRIGVRLGDIVDPGGATAGPAPRFEGWAPCKARLRLEYRASTAVSGFGDAMFAMEPAADGAVVPVFLPWHRRFSHSVAAAAGVTALAGTFAGAIGAAAAGGAFALHILLDQAGFLGSNLFWPFSRTRVQGLQCVRSDSPLGNFSAVWLSCAVIFFNLAAASGRVPPLRTLRWTSAAAGLPLLAAVITNSLLARKKNRRTLAAAAPKFY